MDSVPAHRTGAKAGAAATVVELPVDEASSRAGEARYAFSLAHDDVKVVTLRPNGSSLAVTCTVGNSSGMLLEESTHVLQVPRGYSVRLTPHTVTVVVRGPFWGSRRYRF